MEMPDTVYIAASDHYNKVLNQVAIVKSSLWIATEAILYRSDNTIENMKITSNLTRDVLQFGAKDIYLCHVTLKTVQP